MNQTRPKEFMAFLLNHVQREGGGRSVENRGVLADLRQGFGGGASNRSWKHIARFCDLREDERRIPFATVGAGFATHKGTDPRGGNLGNTLRRIALEGSGKNKDEALSSFDGRFRRLLTCQTAMEVCGHLPGVLRAAERENIGVDYDLLLRDLLNWSQDVKLRWAEAYWGTSPTGDEGGGA